MGLTIVSYPIHDGLATLPNVYVNIRNLETTKDIKDYNTNNTPEYIYKFQFVVNFQINEKQIDTNLITKESETPFIINLWDLAYTEIKKKLDAQNLSYSDNN